MLLSLYCASVRVSDIVLVYLHSVKIISVSQHLTQQMNTLQG